MLRRLRRAWFVVCGRIAYRRLLLLERRLDEPIGDVAPLVPVTHSLLRETEVLEYAALVPDTDPAEIRARLEAGQKCFAARVDGRLVCVRWAGTGRMPLDYLGSDLDLSPDEANIYGLYVDPAFRGHAISPAGSVAMLRHLRDAGFRRVVTTVLPENFASRRSVEKTGYRAYGMVGRVKVGPWTWHFLRIRSASHRAGDPGLHGRTRSQGVDVHGLPDKTGGSR